MNPSIPIHLYHRPVVGGLAAPYISVEHRDGRAVLGVVHNSRLERCLAECLCQTCGEPLRDRVVVMFRPSDKTAGYASEPGMHPECAAYSMKACPVLNGTAAKHRTAPRNLEGQPCGEPGCDCAGWVSTDPKQADARARADVDPYFAMWLRRSDYRIVNDELGRPSGIVLVGFEPLKVRPVNPLAREMHERLLAFEQAFALMGGD